MIHITRSGIRVTHETPPVGEPGAPIDWLDEHTQPNPTDQAALFADLPIDATLTEAQAAMAALRSRVSSRLAALRPELEAVAALVECGAVIVDDVDLDATHSAIIECQRRLCAELRRRGVTP